MSEWKRLLSQSITTGEQPAELFEDVDVESIEKVRRIFPMRINRYFLNYEGKIYTYPANPPE